VAGITPDAAFEAAAEAMAGRFGWEGASDCSVTACAAFEALTGLDLMVGLRGQYHDRRSALALIRARGGFTPMWQSQARAAGLISAGERPGALGIICPRWRVLALCIEPGLWAAKARRGLILTRINSESCWNA